MCLAERTEANESLVLEYGTSHRQLTSSEHEHFENTRQKQLKREPTMLHYTCIMYIPPN